ncbi:50S ribosomal protein L18e [Candidatus Woesearchaeota archaeon]|nr:50S ribosomal protein L18e [Candidatus Woesearchaeota archaeon]
MTTELQKTNVQLYGLISMLKQYGREQNVHLWRRIASDLEKPTRQRRIVNLWKIEKYARDGEIVLVPGKVLGTGEVQRKLQVAAYNFSESAKEKILKANGQCLSIPELLQKNPKGQKVRIIG